jgi:hypothetical protein
MTTRLKRGLIQIDILPLTTLDPRTNLCRCLPLLRLLVGVDRLLHARRTSRPVGSLKAAMQTVVPHYLVTVAVAGLLMQHRGNRFGHFVSSHLVRMSEIGSR